MADPELKLPRLPTAFGLLNAAGGPSGPFQRWWQQFANAIETAFRNLTTTVAAVVTAQAAAVAAQADADAAQLNADALETPSYLTLANTAQLAAERRLVGGTGVAITDAGAGSTATIEIDTVTDLGYTPANKAGDTFGGAINAPQVRITSGGGAPTASTDPGVAGQIAWDAGFIYVCIAANTWVRAATATF